MADKRDSETFRRKVNLNKIMLLDYILLVFGFVVLIKGAEFLVDGASSIAQNMRVSALVIGLTVVAFGTSAPEMFVNLFASFNASTELAIGNVLGSNIANIFLILGISSIIYPLVAKRNTIWKEIPFAILAILLLALVANDSLIDGSSFSIVSRIDGIVLLSFLIIFLYYSFAISKIGVELDKPIEARPTGKSLAMVFLGFIGLALGGNWVVRGSVTLANVFGFSEALIGLTVVAIGTSLPELATSAVAAYKRHTDIAIGNIIGSCIFNIFWILGLSSVIRPIPFAVSLNIDVLIAFFATILLFVFMFIGKKNALDRGEGITFLLIYLVYIIFLIFRG